MPEKPSAAELKPALVKHCRQLGFDAVRVATPEPLADELARHKEWLKRGYGAGMPYLERDPESRFDPQSLLPECRSVIVLAHSYNTGGPGRGVLGHIARYAWGDDYHDVMLDKLKLVSRWLGRRVEGHSCKATADMSPVSEKALAVRAGIGWQGGNTLVLNRELGSWFVIGLVLTNAVIEPDPPVPDGCGDCTLCIEACPVCALVEPRLLDASRCLSFQTTSRRGNPAGVADLAGRLFACDICQDVCPYNKSAATTGEPRFQPREALAGLDLLQLVEMDRAERARVFAGTAMADFGLERLVETAKVLIKR